MATLRTLLQRSLLPRLSSASKNMPGLFIRSLATTSRNIPESPESPESPVTLEEPEEPVFTTNAIGIPSTLQWRMYFVKGANRISPWHDIPLSSSPGTFNFITEIPRGTMAKMEIATRQSLNPIKQDVKDGKLRFLTHGKVLYNYGALPQTWENPFVTNKDVNDLPGDDDPVDVIEIGKETLPMGAVTKVKALGVLGLIDGEECDWKVIAININDPMEKELNDIEDVETKMPGVLDEIRTWYRVYKIAEGKSENTYAFNGQAKNK
eukprot:Ihof_evm1s205 gene=Ihof_evmTU1s205